MAVEKRRKSEHNNIVGGEDRQRRNGKVEQKEQFFLAGARVPQYRRREIAEKACFVQKHGKQGHGEKQHHVWP